MYHVFQNHKIQLSTAKFDEASKLAIELSANSSGYEQGATIYQSHTSADHLDEVAYFRNGAEFDYKRA